MKEIKIELTEQCKRWCIHCSSEAKDIHFKYLNETLVKRIIREAVLLKANSVVFTGGEATLYPSLEELVSFAHNSGLHTKLYTMCDPKEESISKIQNLVTYGLDEMIYSTTYHLTRDGIVTLEKLQEFFPQLLKKSDIHLGFHHTITSETVRDIDDTVNLFFSLPEEQTTKLSFLRFVPHGRGTKTLTLSKKELLWFKEKMIQYKKQYGEKIRLGSPWNFLGIEHTPCSAAESSMIIGFDGRVYPCDAMKYFDYLGFGGTIYEHTLDEIYHSPYFENIRKFKDCTLEDCHSCSQFNICNGGCLGQKMVSFMENKNLTFAHYGYLAKRTMNDFNNDMIKRMNGEMGIVGEIGELIDSFKKYKTHNLDETSKEKILQNLKVEIGDVVWYLAASLSSSYGFTFEDIGNFLFQKNSKRKPVLNEVSIISAANQRDPECLKQHQNDEIPISHLDKLSYGTYEFEEEWKKLVRYSCEIIYTSNKEEVLEKSALLLITLSRIASVELETSMESILQNNIEKLKKRYQNGFDSNIASSRIELLTRYKESEPSKQKTKI